MLIKTRKTVSELMVDFGISDPEQIEQMERAIEMKRPASEGPCITELSPD
jgi:hypothetical protein